MLFDMKRNNKNGMAIVIVLCIASVVLVLGTVYVKHYSQTAPEAKLQYDRIQADFLAKGIQNIAVFKIKKYPDFFIRSYRQYIYWQRTKTESDLPKLDAEQSALPMPYEYFLGKGSGLKEGILMGDFTDDFIEPLGKPIYTTDISLISSKDFQTESIEISVDLQLNANRPVNNYKTVISGELTKNE
jgi:hypothetical protein